jgi:flagellar motor switch protein FliG
MGEELAARVLGDMDDAEALALAGALLDLGVLSGDEVHDVLAELLESVDLSLTMPAPGEGFTREVLHRARGPEEGERIMAEATRPEPFAWLIDAKPEVVATVLAGQQPQTCALALAQLARIDQTAAAKLLNRLPLKMRQQVAARIATLKTVSAQVVETVDETLRVLVGDAASDPEIRMEGPEVLAGMLNASSREDEQAVMAALAMSSPMLAEEIRQRLFTFADLLRLDVRAVQKVLGSADARTLAVALRGATPELEAWVRQNISERAQESLAEEESLLGAVPASEVKAARSQIVSIVRSLEDEGQITVQRLSEEAL